MQTFANQASQCSPYIGTTATTMLAMGLQMVAWVSHDITNVCQDKYMPKPQNFGNGVNAFIIYMICFQVYYVKQYLIGESNFSFALIISYNVHLKFA